MKDSADFGLVPLPLHVSAQPGRFDLRAAALAVVVATGSPLRGEALAFARRLSRLRGSPVPVVEDAPTPRVRFDARDHDGNDESYELTVGQAEVRIAAATAVGAYRATQTLMQLLPAAASAGSSTAASSAAYAGPLVLPGVAVQDRPRFRWRGLMLDVCRHLFTKDDLLRHLDAMAMHKLNVFHWHLTDDQGWRLFVEARPDLAGRGGFRAGGDGVLSPSEGPRLTPAPGRYGGFYTHADVREVVAYAAERHITVVPEIEMPGHALAALTAYPELACADGPFEPATQMGVFKDVFCAGNDATFDFLQDVLAEVCDLFPSEFVHIGGDECPKDRWKTCPKCQARIAAEKLGDEHGLQSYFVRRIGRFLKARGKRLVGWDEILEGGLAPDATVMSWRGTEGGIAAARAGHDVVMTPHMHLYLDYRQAESGEPLAIPSPAPVELADVYAYEPVPEELSPAQARHVLGLQANLWTEYVPDFRHVQYMTWPRGAAVAEVGWSASHRRDWDDFRHRLRRHLSRLTAAGVHYRVPEDAAPAPRVREAVPV